jgi:hypothetical protein
MASHAVMLTMLHGTAVTSLLALPMERVSSSRQHLRSAGAARKRRALVVDCPAYWQHEQQMHALLVQASTKRCG